MAEDVILHEGDLPPFQQSWQEFFTRTGLCRETYSRFRSIIFHYYFTHQRTFSWRSHITPYRVVVSELMLQQTQTIRVAEKFEPFITAFPDFNSLAKFTICRDIDSMERVGIQQAGQISAGYCPNGDPAVWRQPAG